MAADPWATWQTPQPKGYEPQQAGYEPPADPPAVILSPEEYRQYNLGRIPQEGDVLIFNSDRHAIFDGFPVGVWLRKDDSFVDMTSTITVAESKVCERTVTNGKGRKRRLRYVGVSFINGDGRVCWTNYKNDGKGNGKGAWMTLIPQPLLTVTVTPLPALLPPAMSQPGVTGATLPAPVAGGISQCEDFSELD